jgi:hypothetical protein
MLLECPLVDNREVLRALRSRNRSVATGIIANLLKSFAEGRASLSRL